MGKKTTPPPQTVYGSNTSVLEPDPPFWTKTSWLQLGYAVWVNMTVLGIGLLFGFPAVAIPQMEDKDSLIEVSEDEGAWIASIVSLTSPIGSILCGLIMDKYGRRIVLILCEVPIIFGWFYIASASSAKDIIIGRLVTGIGLGMAMVAPRAYLNEITLPNMRGVLGALPNLFTSFGLSLQAGLGAFLSWNIICYICGFYALLIFVFNCFLPETPYFILMKATASNARANLRKFRSSKFNLDAEVDALNEFKNDNNIRSLTIKDRIRVVFSRASCKPFAIVSIYIWFMQLSGVNVVIMWSVEMLEASNLSMDVDLANILLGLPRIIFGVVTSILLFTVRKRVMAMISAIGVGTSAIAYGAFLDMYEKQSIWPLLIFASYMAFSALGFITLPLLYTFELLPLQVRGLLSGVCLTQLNLLMFALNRMFPYTRDSLGLGNTMIMYGVWSLLGAVVLYCILPETKDLTLREIEEFYNTRRPTLTSQRRLISQMSSRGISGPSGTNMRSDMQVKHGTVDQTKSADAADNFYKNSEDQFAAQLVSLSEGHKQPKDLREPIDQKDWKDQQDSKDQNNSKDQKDPKDQKDSKDQKDPTNQKDPKDPKDPKGPKSTPVIFRDD